MGYQNYLTQVDKDGNATVTDLGEIPFWSLNPEQAAVVLLICILLVGSFIPPLYAYPTHRSMRSLVQMLYL